MKNNIKPLVISISIASFLSVATPAFALGEPSDRGVRFAPSPNSMMNENRQERMEEAKNKLSDIRLRSCQARENAIQTRSGSLGKMTDNMFAKFTSIENRIKEYYTSSGLTVENYDALISDIDVKKVAAQAAITQAQSDVRDFSCDSDDPKGVLTQYRKDMQSVITAMKEYRTSIRNLIVAVRKVAPDDVKPSFSPKASGAAYYNRVMNENRGKNK